MGDFRSASLACFLFDRTFGVIVFWSYKNWSKDFHDNSHPWLQSDNIIDLFDFCQFFGYILETS